MKEVVGSYTGKKLGPTYFQGLKPIDGIRATSDMTIALVCVMPVGFGIGDHRLFVVDVLTASLIGSEPIRIVRPHARRLNTKIPCVLKAYNEELERQVLFHQVVERMGNAHESNTSMTQAEKELNKIDVELKDYMIHTEQKCSKIRSGRIPFSPEAGKWIRRLQIYDTLLRRQRGQRCNLGNLRQAALRGGINNPFELLEHEILLRIKVCREHCDFYREHGQQY
jgi:hypothetical protein